MTEMTALTEFEENVSFDADDPDFAPSPSVIQNVLRDVRRFAKNARFDVEGPRPAVAVQFDPRRYRVWLLRRFICEHLTRFPFVVTVIRTLLEVHQKPSTPTRRSVSQLCASYPVFWPRDDTHLSVQHVGHFRAASHNREPLSPREQHLVVLP